MKVTHKQAAARILRMQKAGRLIPNSFQDTDKKGHRLACLIGAISPSISNVGHCPAYLMPQWMANVTIHIFDRIEDRDTWAMRYAESMKSWKLITPEDWRAIKANFIFKILRRCHKVMSNLPHEKKGDYDAVAGDTIWKLLADGHVGFNPIEGLKPRSSSARRLPRP